MGGEATGVVPCDYAAVRVTQALSASTPCAEPLAKCGIAEATQATEQRVLL